eukprot:6206000-Pleurochrysis_carterae.AAC.1
MLSFPCSRRAAAASAAMLVTPSNASSVALSCSYPACPACLARVAAMHVVGILGVRRIMHDELELKLRSMA